MSSAKSSHISFSDRFGVKVIYSESRLLIVVAALSRHFLAIPLYTYASTGLKYKDDVSDDSACINQLSPLQDFKGCVSIYLTSKYVGINWGNWPVGMDAFDAFKDNSCQSYAAKTMVEPAGSPDTQGANTCYELGAHGGPWGGVQQNYDN
ncbi:hypothetical protein OEA41_002498 [Lepraria neglecta]|uniref:Uncharacterized protein n=1 Tax=Lepraria neglecta TaxID=209136 RepID=A0AAD9ZBN6_9LECA|nr:hypothetical protein OEA41_002498 [Lepraria neglecta]